jgi:hypothetical protein
MQPRRVAQTPAPTQGEAGQHITAQMARDQQGCSKAQLFCGLTELLICALTGAGHRGAGGRAPTTHVPQQRSAVPGHRPLRGRLPGCPPQTSALAAAAGLLRLPGRASCARWLCSWPEGHPRHHRRVQRLASPSPGRHPHRWRATRSGWPGEASATAVGGALAGAGAAPAPCRHPASLWTQRPGGTCRSQGAPQRRWRRRRLLRAAAAGAAAGGGGGRAESALPAPAAGWRCVTGRDGQMGMAFQKAISGALQRFPRPTEANVMGTLDPPLPAAQGKTDKW